MNIKSVRREFPFLKRKFKGQPLAYLDNASTTQKPKSVIDSLVDTYSNHYANIHRGVYDLSVEATDAFEGVREKVRKFINAKNEKEIIFTRNATEAINLVAYSLGSRLKSNDEILLTQMEHHSNIVPWQLIAERLTKAKGLKTNAKRQIQIKYIPIDSEGRLDLSTLDRLVTKKTKVVSLTLMSNVLGTVNPIREIIKRVRELSTVNRQQAPLVLIDAAQAAGHIKIDVGEFGCDFLVFSAHKMYGPSGVGMLWGRQEILGELPPFLGGGDMILSVDFESTTFNQLPWKFEAGTPNIADVIAFGEALNFVENLGFEVINKHEMVLTQYCLKKLSNDPTIQLFGPLSLENRGPVISFNVDPSAGRSTLRDEPSGHSTVSSDRIGSDSKSSGQAIHPHDVASVLSEEAVAIRSGHHCAQPLMSVLGIGAACRVSFGIYNTEEEVDRLMEGIEKVKKVFKPKSTVYRPQSLQL